MSNAEQTRRLLRELERVDRAYKADDAALSPEPTEPTEPEEPEEPEESLVRESDITAAAMFEALLANDFNLTAAIVDVRRGS